MTITDGNKTMTLEELAKKICNSFDCDRYCDGGCPAAHLCHEGHNGMLDWLRKVVAYEHD